MKKPLAIAGILTISLILSLSMSFFVFNTQNGFPSLTGFAILNNGSQEIDETKKQDNSLEITESFALEAINESKIIIINMKENGFAAIFVEDALIEAERKFKQAKYAEILRNNNVEESKLIEARQALELVDWEELSFVSVIEQTDKIKDREALAFSLHDSINALKIATETAKRSKQINSTESNKLIEKAEQAFIEDRYQEADTFLKLARDSLDEEKSTKATLNTVKNNAKSYIQRNLVPITIILIVLAIMFTLAYKKIKKALLKNKIRKMRAERTVLTKLIKQAQIDRFKQNKISGLTYNIRIKKYQEKLQQIKQDLPILEKSINTN